MLFTIKDLEKIENLDELKLPVDLHDISVAQAFELTEDGHIEQTSFITKEFMAHLKERGVKKVNIIIPKEMLPQLRGEYPEIFPKAHYSHSVEMIKDKFEVFQELNEKTEKKRSMFIAEDIYRYDPGNGEYKSIVPFGAPVNKSTFRTLQEAGIGDQQQLDYTESENGVLVFVPGSQNIKLRIDVFAVLAFLDYKIYDAESTEEALEIYKEKKPKLVVLGHLASQWQSKQLYMYIEEYDFYAKILNYDKSPSEQRNEEAKKIRAAYNKDYRYIIQSKTAEMQQLKSKDKAELPEEKKKALMAKIRKIQQSEDVESFINTWFMVRHFGKTFDVTSVEVMLKRVRKNLPIL